MSLHRVRSGAKERTVMLTVGLTIVGYGAVIGVFVVPQFQALFPTLTRGTVELLTHAIALVNTITIVTLSAGWYWIRRGNVRKHAAAMITSFGLIILFLGMYLPRVAGGGTKYFVGPEPVYYAYLILLAIHILLSVLAVPVVLYAVLLGLTHSERELRDRTPHAFVGRIAVVSWLLSLVLGVVTYLLLNHLYDSTFEAATTVLVPGSGFL